MALGDNEEELETSPVDTPPDTEPKRKGRPPGSPNRSKVESSPKSDRSPRQGRPSKPQWAKEASVYKALTSIFDGAAFGLEFFSPSDAVIVNKHSSDIVTEIVALALVEPRYRKTLEKLALPGIYGPLLMAVGPMVFDIAKNHGLFDIGRKVKGDNLEETTNTEVTE